jgi:hypothetical protein
MAVLFWYRILFYLFFIFRYHFGIFNALLIFFIYFSKVLYNFFLCREKFQLLLNYCVNIICYMMFKAKVSSARSCRVVSYQLDEWFFVKALYVADEQITNSQSKKFSVADPHNVDADPYPDPACYFDADPDPIFQIKAQNLEKVL